MVLLSVVFLTHSKGHWHFGVYYSRLSSRSRNITPSFAKALVLHLSSLDSNCHTRATSNLHPSFLLRHSIILSLLTRARDLPRVDLFQHSRQPFKRRDPRIPNTPVSEKRAD